MKAYTIYTYTIYIPFDPLSGAPWNFVKPAAFDHDN